jgi:hypothetical protein
VGSRLTRRFSHRVRQHLGRTGTEIALDNATVSNKGTGLFTFGAAVLDVFNSNITVNAPGASGAVPPAHRVGCASPAAGHGACLNRFHAK